jgi:hypothetical protein
MAKVTHTCGKNLDKLVNTTNQPQRTEHAHDNVLSHFHTWMHCIIHIKAKTNHKSEQYLANTVSQCILQY